MTHRASTASSTKRCRRPMQSIRSPSRCNWSSRATCTGSRPSDFPPRTTSSVLVQLVVGNGGVSLARNHPEDPFSFPIDGMTGSGFGLSEFGYMEIELGDAGRLEGQVARAKRRHLGQVRFVPEVRDGGVRAGVSVSAGGSLKSTLSQISCSGRRHSTSRLSRHLPHQVANLLHPLGRVAQVPEEAQLVAAVELELLGPGLDQLDQWRRVDLGLGVEQDAPARGAGLDLADAEGLDLELELGDVEQVLAPASGSRPKRSIISTCSSSQLVVGRRRWRCACTASGACARPAGSRPGAAPGRAG